MPIRFQSGIDGGGHSEEWDDNTREGGFCSDGTYDARTVRQSPRLVFPKTRAATPPVPYLENEKN
jgi:hypothetical protein